jgi:hypothetical protein
VRVHENIAHEFDEQFTLFKLLVPIGISARFQEPFRERRQVFRSDDVLGCRDLALARAEALRFEHERERSHRRPDRVLRPMGTCGEDRARLIRRFDRRIDGHRAGASRSVRSERWRRRVSSDPSACNGRDFSSPQSLQAYRPVDRDNAHAYAQQMSLLDGLDDVPWANLKHAYGRAAQVPLLLRALVDPTSASGALAADTTPMGLVHREGVDRSLQEAVVERLRDALYHQESRYPASVKAIPFIAEILRDGPDDGKLHELLLDFLLALAIGCPDDSFPARRFAVDPSEGDVDDEDRWGHPLGGRDEMACYEAVQAELSTIERFVTHPIEAPALCAIAVLAFFAESAARSCDVLRGLEEDPSLRLRPLLVACSFLARANLGDTSVRASAESLLDHRDRNVVIHAACAGILADPQNVSAGALRALREVRAPFEDEPSPFTWTIGTLVRHCLRCVPRAR